MFINVLVNARLAKKQKSPQRSSDLISEQKVEGLRNRVRKSTIEAAIELRAKRDIPSVSKSHIHVNLSFFLVKNL